MCRVGAQDSAPVLLSRTGGGAGWATIAELRVAAGKGNPQACAQLGERLLNGDGLPADGPRALVLLEQAARAGVASAAFRLGMVLEAGESVERDRPRAFGYFHAAAAGGVEAAFRNVGIAYSTGHGVKRDYVEALGWLLLAQKHRTAGTVADEVRAQILALNRPEWLAAAAQRAPEIERELARATVAGLLPAPAPLTYVAPSETPGSPVKLVLPSRHRVSWPSLDALQRAADRGEPVALAAFGQTLLEGKLLPADPARAVPLLERGATAGDADAAQQLAELYLHGEHVTPDAGKLFAYTLQAARGGVPTAIYNLGALYANGTGTGRDFTAALAWLLVAEHNHLDSGQLQRIKDYLTRNHPEQIPLAESRAANLTREIDAARDNWVEP